MPQSWPDGHFYSPVPSRTDIESGLASAPAEILGIDFNETSEKEFLRGLVEVYGELRFPETKTSGRRYFYRNGSFGALDAVSLAAVAKRFRPRRIVEVGSGHSSAAMLDLRDDGLLADCQLSFIDPDFGRLEELLLPGDQDRVTLIRSKVQDVPLTTYAALESGDLLFVDSSHVSKVGSDVNHLLFNVFPRLKSGVLIHIHDIFATFEYPVEWFREGRSWNEQYLVRAFLMYNSAFEVVALTSRIFDTYNATFREKLPATLATGGGQLWLRKKGSGPV